MRAGGIYLFGEPTEEEKSIPNEYDKELDDINTELKIIVADIEITIEDIVNKQNIVNLYLNGSYKIYALDRLEKAQMKLIEILDEYEKLRKEYRNYIDENIGKFNEHSNEYSILDIWVDATKIVEICYNHYIDKFK